MKVNPFCVAPGVESKPCEIEPAALFQGPVSLFVFSLAVLCCLLYNSVRCELRKATITIVTTITIAMNMRVGFCTVCEQVTWNTDSGLADTYVFTWTSQLFLLLERFPVSFASVPDFANPTLVRPKFLVYPAKTEPH